MAKADAAAKMNAIVDALILLGITSERLAGDIDADLVRGMLTSVRSRLAFVDALISARREVLK